MHVEINAATIPDCLRAALAACGKKGGTVEIKAAERIHAGGCAFTGNRPVACAVNLDTGERSEIRHGSWGGANPFVDVPLDRPKDVAIPPRTAIVEGETGGRGTFVKVYVHPASLAPLLPQGDRPELCPELQRTLDAHCGLNSRGRSDHFRRNPVQYPGGLDAAKTELARLGLLQVSRNGAAKVTAAGRNARKETSIY